jgi:PKD repeat protein
LQPVVNFTADQYVLCSSNVVRFTDQSTNCPSTWLWNFNPATITFLEGTTSQSQNPVVQFDAAGYYDVQLVCSNSVGTEAKTKLDYIVKDGYGLPFTESFGTGIDTRHWQIMNPDNSVTWDTIAVGGLASGAKAIYMNFFNYTTLNKRDQLISPALNLSGYSSVMLSFKHAYEQRVRKDSIIVRISDNCGLSWQRVWGMGPDGTPGVFVTHPSTDSAFYPKSSDDWCGGSYGTACYTIDITPWANQPNIQLMFESYNRYGNNLFISDILISGPVGQKENISGKSSVNIYPNPSDGLFNLTMANIWTNVKAEVMNLQGNLLFTDLLIPAAGNVSKQINLSYLHKGIYFIRLTGDDGTWVEKVVVE